MYFANHYIYSFDSSISLTFSDLTLIFQASGMTINQTIKNHHERFIARAHVIVDFYIISGNLPKYPDEITCQK